MVFFLADLKGFKRTGSPRKVLLVNNHFSREDNSINDFCCQVKVTKPENTQSEMYNG